MARPTSPHQPRLLALLESQPPLPSAAFAPLLGLSVERTRQLLRRLRADGLAIPSCNGAAALWSTPAKIAEHRKRVKVVDHQAYVERERARKRRVWHEMQERQNAAFINVRQAIVPANDCPPLKPRGPNSVFNLAQCAA